MPADVDNIAGFHEGTGLGKLVQKGSVGAVCPPSEKAGNSGNAGVGVDNGLSWVLLVFLGDCSDDDGYGRGVCGNDPTPCNGGDNGDILISGLGDSIARGGCSALGSFCRLAMMDATNDVKEAFGSTDLGWGCESLVLASNWSSSSTPRPSGNTTWKALPRRSSLDLLA